MKFDSVKINVVVMKGFNDDVRKVSKFYKVMQELVDFVRYVKDRPVEVRFIEFMPFNANDWSNKKLLPYFEIRSRI